jgi:hypothetical protein
LKKIQHEKLEQTEGDYEYGTLQVNMALEARTIALSSTSKIADEEIYPSRAEDDSQSEGNDEE